MEKRKTEEELVAIIQNAAKELELLNIEKKTANKVEEIIKNFKPGYYKHIYGDSNAIFYLTELKLIEGSDAYGDVRELVYNGFSIERDIDDSNHISLKREYDLTYADIKHNPYFKLIDPPENAWFMPIIETCIKHDATVFEALFMQK